MVRPRRCQGSTSSAVSATVWNRVPSQHMPQARQSVDPSFSTPSGYTLPRAAQDQLERALGQRQREPPNNQLEEAQLTLAAPESTAHPVPLGHRLIEVARRGRRRLIEERPALDEG